MGEREKILQASSMSIEMKSEWKQYYLATSKVTTNQDGIELHMDIE